MNSEENIRVKNGILELIRQYSKSGIFISKSNILNLLSEKCTSHDIDSILLDLQKDSEISCHGGVLYYTKESGVLFQESDFVSSEIKIGKVKQALNVISKISTIKFIGITGSSTFDMVGIKDDVDIFVVVRENTLFLTRLLIFVVTICFGNFRTSKSKNIKDTLCTNIIVEENNLKVPYPKRNLFSARELAQIQPYYNKEAILDKLKEANFEWLSYLLPNIDSQKISFEIVENNNRGSFILAMINNTAAFFQLWKMKSKVTNELVSTKQLWFHPNTRHKFI